MKDTVIEIRDLVKKHNKWFEESIPLIASENCISPLVKEMLTSDFHNRYAEGLPGKRYYNGNPIVDDVERKASELARQLFDCEWADVRPISGNNSNMCIYAALTQPGDDYTACNLDDGAHISSAPFGAAGVRGLKQHTYPFDQEIMNIDIDGSIKLLKEVKPKLAMFGLSVFLFPTPIKELKDTLEEIDCHVWYDAAHVLGLIGGGEFQDPLREGVHLITGSTHKTLPGPQGGIIFGNPKDIDQKKKVRSRVFPGLHSNHHLHHMAGKAIAFAEHIEFGKAYAKQIIKNSQALAQAMHENGFTVLGEHLGFTKSHTTLYDLREQGKAKELTQILEDCNIITNMNLIPNDPGTPMNPSGMRLGTPECTRIGMVESDMKHIADLFKMALIDKKPVEEVKASVKDFKKDFTKIKFCFEKDSDAYKYFELVKEL